MGLSSGIQEGRAERAAQANAEANSALSSSLLGSLLRPSTPSTGGGWTGMAPTADVAPSPSVASALMQSPQMVANQPPVPGLQPSGEGGASYIRQGLVARGLPEHEADAFVVNFQDESGLNPGINEKNPIVPGSRGGFGLYQLTGPRRVAYEQYAAERGVPVDDVDAQLDFMMGELQGSEAKAAQNILTAPDTATAAQAIVRDFLRPSPQYRDSRMAKYAALPTQGGATGAVNAMAQGGQMPMPEVSGYVDPMVSAQNSRVAPTPSVEVAQALAPQPNAGYFPPAPQAGGLDPAVIQALSDPTVSPQNRQIAMSLVEQYQARQQAAQEQAQAQALRQQEIQQRQQFLAANNLDPNIAFVDEAFAEAAKSPFRQRNTAVVNGVLVDAETGTPIYEGRREQPTSVQEYEYGLENPGYFDTQERFKRAGATNIDLGQNKFVAEFGSLDAKALQEVGTAGMAARRNLGRIDQLESLLTEAPSGFTAALAQRAGEFGIKTEGLDQIQAAQAVINSLVPEQRQPGSGPMSDADLELFKQSLPRIINQPGGNKIILDTMRAIAQYDAEGAAVIQKLRSGDINRAEAFDMLYNRPNPLEAFKAPAAPTENPLPPQATGQRKRLKFTADGELVE